MPKFDGGDASRTGALENEVKRLREENIKLRAKIVAARIRLPERPMVALAILLDV